MCVDTKQQLSSTYYKNGILDGNRFILSKAITLIESTLKQDEEIALTLLDELTLINKTAKRIAITGSPGVGKSTFINAFGKFLSSQQKSVAVLAVDPSSSESRGSILGDKTRMEDLLNDEHIYIRPTASALHLGGASPRTRDVISLCEAFGFDYILVETVGVGQSETAAKDLTDLFLLLIQPNAGDELQGIKKGIMEMADILIINKSEASNLTQVNHCKAQLLQAIRLTKNKDIPILAVSSTEHTGMEKVFAEVEQFFQNHTNNGKWLHKREEQKKTAVNENLRLLFDNWLNHHTQDWDSADEQYPQLSARSQALTIFKKILNRVLS